MKVTQGDWAQVGREYVSWPLGDGIGSKRRKLWLLDKRKAPAGSLTPGLLIAGLS